jgi:ABC-type transporter Mla subunit MlaD
MTASAYGFGWPTINPAQSTPWGQGFGSHSQLGFPLQQQFAQLLHTVPQQLQNLQQLTYLQQQQLQQIQQLLLLVPQQVQQAVQQIAHVVGQHIHQIQPHAAAVQSPFGFTQPGAGTPFQVAPPFGQSIFAGQPGQVM